MHSGVGIQDSGLKKEKMMAKVKTKMAARRERGVEMRMIHG